MSGNSLRSLLEQKGRWNKQAWDRWKNSIKHLQESTSVILKPLAFLRPYVSLNCCHLKEFSYTDLVNLLIELVIRQLLRIEKYFIHVLSKSCSPPKIRSLKNLCSASLIAFSLLKKWSFPLRISSPWLWPKQWPWPNPQFPVYFVRFIKEILNERLHFLCSASVSDFSLMLPFYRTWKN